jgi:hypothetical protein
VGALFRGASRIHINRSMFSHNSAFIEESGHPRYEQEAPVVCRTHSWRRLMSGTLGRWESFHLSEAERSRNAKEYSRNTQRIFRECQGTFRERLGVVRLFWGVLGPQVDSPPMQPGVEGFSVSKGLMSPSPCAFASIAFFWYPRNWNVANVKRKAKWGDGKRKAGDESDKQERKAKRKAHESEKRETKAKRKRTRRETKAKQKRNESDRNRKVGDESETNAEQARKQNGIRMQNQCKRKQNAKQNAKRMQRKTNTKRIDAN